MLATKVVLLCEDKRPGTENNLTAGIGNGRGKLGLVFDRTRFREDVQAAPFLVLGT